MYARFSESAKEVAPIRIALKSLRSCRTMSIAKNYGITEEELNKLRSDKHRNRGGFARNMFLEKIE
jgi:hypothetical protein